MTKRYIEDHPFARKEMEYETSKLAGRSLLLMKVDDQRHGSENGAARM